MSCPLQAATVRGGVLAVTNDIIDADSSTGVFGWMLSHVRSALATAVVAPWAREGNTTEVYAGGNHCAKSLARAISRSWWKMAGHSAFWRRVRLQQWTPCRPRRCRRRLVNAALDALTRSGDCRSSVELRTVRTIVEVSAPIPTNNTAADQSLTWPGQCLGRSLNNEEPIPAEKLTEAPQSETTGNAYPWATEGHDDRTGSDRQDQLRPQFRTRLDRNYRRAGARARARITVVVGATRRGP